MSVPSSRPHESFRCCTVRSHGVPSGSNVPPSSGLFPFSSYRPPIFRCLNITIHSIRNNVKSYSELFRKKCDIVPNNHAVCEGKDRAFDLSKKAITTAIRKSKKCGHCKNEVFPACVSVLKIRISQ